MEEYFFLVLNKKLENPSQASMLSDDGPSGRTTRHMTPDPTDTWPILVAANIICCNPGECAAKPSCVILSQEKWILTSLVDSPELSTFHVTHSWSGKCWICAFVFCFISCQMQPATSISQMLRFSISIFQTALLVISFSLVGCAKPQIYFFTALLHVGDSYNFDFRVCSGVSFGSHIVDEW